LVDSSGGLIAETRILPAFLEGAGWRAAKSVVKLSDNHFGNSAGILGVSVEAQL
jgi:hypothetical protein